MKTGRIGHRLENWFLNECQTWLNKTPGKHNVNYWRTATGVEVDFVIEKSPAVFPFEITCHSHIERKKIRNLSRFREYQPKADFAIYIYSGDFKLDRKNNIIFIPAWAVC